MKVTASRVMFRLLTVLLVSLVFFGGVGIYIIAWDGNDGLETTSC
jgi:phage shock protein PspC (stress-responsive transcriptional regulator)